MRKIIIKNFRQITYAEIEIKNITLFIGEQASGKSTIAKLIYFFESIDELGIKNLEWEKFETDLKKKFISYFGYATELDDTFEITWISKNEKEIFINKKNEKEIYFGFLDNFKERYKTFFETVNNAYNTIVNGILKNIPHNSKEFSDLVNNMVSNAVFLPKFLPAGRNISISYPEQFQSAFIGNIYNNIEKPNSSDMILMRDFILHSKSLQDYFAGNNFELIIENHNEEHVTKAALNFLKNHAEYILKGKYENENGYESITYETSTQKNKRIGLQSASSGQQEAIKIIQDLFYILHKKEQTFRVIEEPEAHLYPKAQKKLIELMTLVANITDSNILITTHSPYILSILNNLLMYSAVAKNNPSALEQIEAHFGTQTLHKEKNERINLTADQIQVYAIQANPTNPEDYCTSIIDKETGLIGENYLDSVTEELNNDFEVLYRLNFQKN